jgi:hypothetical protein
MKEYRRGHVWLNLNLVLDRGECLMERNYLEVLGVDGSIIYKMDLK